MRNETGEAASAWLRRSCRRDDCDTHPFFPHISPALPGSGARRAALEAIGLVAGWGGGGHVQQCAQVDKVELITGALVERVVTPLFDKLLGGHLLGTSF
jgi:hypothetical protein